MIRALAETGRRCLVTGSEAERPLTAAVVERVAQGRRAGAGSVLDAGGRFDLAGLSGRSAQ